MCGRVDNRERRGGRPREPPTARPERRLWHRDVVTPHPRGGEAGGLASRPGPMRVLSDRSDDAARPRSSNSTMSEPFASGEAPTSTTFSSDAARTTDMKRGWYFGEEISPQGGPISEDGSDSARAWLSRGV